MNRTEIYEDTYREYSSRVRGYLYNQISNREDADDVFQEVFAGFWKALEKFRGDAKSSTFLRAIVNRKIADYLRSKYREPDKRYIENLEETIHVNISPLNILIAMSQGETRNLLLAIKKTKERDS